MDSTISIACPDCQKSLKGPAELLGKKVRCKSCGHVFVVKATAPSKAKPTSGEADSKTGSSAKAASGKSSGVKTATPSPATPKGSPSGSSKPGRPEDEVGGSYKISDELHVAARCPQCAANMDEDAIVCLECGYNTETRRRIEMIKTYETTGFDRLIWLLPGILCALTSLMGIGLVVFLWIWLWEATGIVFAGKVWGSVFSALIAWKTGQFAYKRLIVHPEPPEKLKRR